MICPGASTVSPSCASCIRIGTSALSDTLTHTSGVWVAKHESSLCLLYGIPYLGGLSRDVISLENWLRWNSRCLSVRGDSWAKCAYNFFHGTSAQSDKSTHTSEVWQRGKVVCLLTGLVPICVDWQEALPWWISRQMLSVHLATYLQGEPFRKWLLAVDHPS